MIIQVENQEELIKLARQAIHLLSALRKSQKIWKDVYGKVARNQMEYFEEKSDAFLASLLPKEHTYPQQIKIEINQNT